MPGTTDDVHVRQTQPFRSTAHRFHAAFFEVQRREVGGRGQFVGKAVLFAGRLDHLFHFGNHRIQPRRLQVAKIQSHAHFAGNHVARAGIGLQAADRATGVGLMAEGGAVDGADDHRGTDQGVLAQVHRRRAGVGFDAAQFQVEPLLPERAEYHADGFLFVLENRALFDVRFEIRANRVPANLARTGIADRIQCFADRDAVGIDLGEGFFEGEFLGEDP